MQLPNDAYVLYFYIHLVDREGKWKQLLKIACANVFFTNHLFLALFITFKQNMHFNACKHFRASMKNNVNFVLEGEK